MTRKEEIEIAIPKNKFGDFHSQVSYEFGFQQGAEWADKTMLDRVCVWLKEHMHFTEGIANGEAYYQCNSMESFLNELKQTMEQ